MTNDQASDVIHFGLVNTVFFSFLLISTSCNNGKPLPELNANLIELIQQKNNLGVHGAMDYAVEPKKVTWPNPFVITMGRRAISLIVTSLPAH